jgi:hypothetical protein
LELVIENDCAVNPETGSPPTGIGQKLALHSTLMAVIGGELSFEQLPGQFSQVKLRAPKGME